jgi:hypothetical protein
MGEGKSNLRVQPHFSRYDQLTSRATFVHHLEQLIQNEE